MPSCALADTCRPPTATGSRACIAALRRRASATDVAVEPVPHRTCGVGAWAPHAYEAVLLLLALHRSFAAKAYLITDAPDDDGGVVTVALHEKRHLVVLAVPVVLVWDGRTRGRGAAVT